MSRLNAERMIENEPQNIMSKQKFEFVNEEAFSNWLEAEKNKIGWVRRNICGEKDPGVCETVC